MKYLILLIALAASSLGWAASNTFNWHSYSLNDQKNIIGELRQFYVDYEKIDPLEASNYDPEISHIWKIVEGVSPIDSAWAGSIKVTYETMCNYGSWSSYFYSQKSSKQLCQNPLETDDYKRQWAVFAPQTSSCRKRNAFLCNPALTGGICVSRYPVSNLTLRCMQNAKPVEEVAKMITENESLQELIQQSYDLSKKYCTENSLQYFCRRLQNRLSQIEMIRKTPVDKQKIEEVSVTTDFFKTVSNTGDPSENLLCGDCATDLSANRDIDPATQCSDNNRNLANNDFWKSIKPIRSSDNEHILPKECIKQIQKKFPGAPNVHYTQCLPGNLTPEKTRLQKPCLTDTYTTAIHSMFNRMSLCMGVKPRVLFGMIAQESGFHPNAMSFTGCLGFGQMGSLLRDVQKNYQLFEDDLEKCGKLIDVPHKDFFNFTSNGKTNKCKLIQNPESLKVNMATAVISMKLNMKYVSSILADKTIDYIVQDLGTEAFYKVKSQLSILTHNSGASVVECLNFFVREKKIRGEKLVAKDLDLYQDPENAPENSFIRFLHKNYLNMSYPAKGRQWPAYLSTEKKRQRRNNEVSHYMININKVSKVNDNQGNPCADQRVYSSL